MFLKKKELEDRKAQQRQLVIAYKQFFNTDAGKMVFRDLFNLFALTAPLSKELSDSRRNERIGENNVIWRIIGNRDQNLDDFELTLKGEK